MMFSSTTEQYKSIKLGPRKRLQPSSYNPLFLFNDIPLVKNEVYFLVKF